MNFVKKELVKMLSGCGSKWGEEKEEGVGFCSGLVLYVWHFLQTICTNLSKEGSHIGILRFYFLFLYLSAITWLYCNLLVMIIELVFHKTIHMLFTLTHAYCCFILYIFVKENLMLKIIVQRFCSCEN